MSSRRNILITGGAGFIGSHVLRLFVNSFPEDHIFNLDALTYAGNLENLTDIEAKSNYTFLHADICDIDKLREIIQTNNISHIVHLAAESHVDRSITDPLEFVKTNVLGTVNLLQVAREYWNEGEHLFYHVSTDEVYGSLGKTGYFYENTAYDPRSPYSASKASSDHFVRAYFHTYKLPVVISNCSNNYGPNHFPEKLIPLMINNIIQNKALPVYGEGLNVRDWLFVLDHATAIKTIFEKGRLGETYNVGGHNEWTNIDLVNLLCDTMDKKLNRELGSSRKLISYVTDRAGHDLRYAIDSSKLQNELGWEPSLQFEEGLSYTVDWFLDNREWLDHVTSGDYLEYYKKHYE